MASFVFFKTLHLIEYGVLFWLTEGALRPMLPWPNRALRLGQLSIRVEPALLALLFVVLYGASDEFHQSLVPSREAKWRDVFIDGVGGWLAWKIKLGREMSV